MWWFCREGNGNPLQCSCLENPRDGGAWRAAIYGVAQSRTRLKRLSSKVYPQTFLYLTLISNYIFSVVLSQQSYLALIPHLRIFGCKTCFVRKTSKWLKDVRYFAKLPLLICFNSVLIFWSLDKLRNLESALDLRCSQIHYGSMGPKLVDGHFTGQLESIC